MRGGGGMRASDIGGVDGHLLPLLPLNILQQIMHKQDEWCQPTFFTTFIP